MEQQASKDPDSIKAWDLVVRSILDFSLQFEPEPEEIFQGSPENSWHLLMALHDIYVSMQDWKEHIIMRDRLIRDIHDNYLRNQKFSAIQRQAFVDLAAHCNQLFERTIQEFLGVLREVRDSEIKSLATEHMDKDPKYFDPRFRNTGGSFKHSAVVEFLRSNAKEGAVLALSSKHVWEDVVTSIVAIATRHVLEKRKLFDLYCATLIDLNLTNRISTRKALYNAYWSPYLLLIQVEDDNGDIRSPQCMRLPDVNRWVRKLASKGVIEWGGDEGAPPDEDEDDKDKAGGNEDLPLQPVKTKTGAKDGDDSSDTIMTDADAAGW